MVASLGRGFREEHRKGRATALVISSNEDGSLKLTQSRVLSTSGVVYTGMRISLSVAMGCMGMLSSLRGARGGINEVRERGSHVGALSRTEFLADLDPGPKHDWVRAALGEPSRTND